VKISSVRFAIGTLSIAFAAALVVAPLSHAQQQPQAPMSTQSVNEMQTRLHLLTDVQRQTSDPKEAPEYKAFYGAQDPAKKIQLGNNFLQKYPKSPFAEPVCVGLMNVYYAKQDWSNFYAFADKALALKPDDVDVLTTVGWVIPHFYNPNDSDAEQRLDKAENYQKLAIEVLAKLPKPPEISDAQFAALKAQKSVQAHSGLGLVYFRRRDFEDSAKQLQQATQGNPSPDQADLFVLGIDLQNTNNDAGAADAFDRCGQIAGGLQDQCKQGANAAKKQAASSKPK
jgi:tetratricopeptide (TPR) repeat protein